MLTAGEVRALRDTLRPDPERLQEYINDWVASELLFQEAARRGLADNEAMNRRLDAVRRRLAIDALLQDVLAATEDTAAVSDDAVAALYASGGQAFLLREDMAKVSFALFDDRDAANAFRSRILRGASWQQAVAAVQQDSLVGPHLRQVATRQYFTRTNLYPEELWKLARTLAHEEVSFVVRTEAGYYTLMVHSLKKQGEMPDLEYARAELRERLVIEERRRAYDRLLAALRSAARVELHPELLDSVATTETLP